MYNADISGADAVSGAGSAGEPTGWRKSSRCDSASCVEVGTVGADVAVRDSKVADGPYLRFSAQQWSAFLAGVRAGDFDLP